MSNNQNFGTPVGSEQNWRAYDALPPRLRRYVREAPYNCNCMRVLQDYQIVAGFDEAAAIRYFARRMFEVRDAALRRDWLPGHPMIGARPKGWRE